VVNVHVDESASRRHVRLVTERTVEHFLRRLFLRDATMRNLCLIAPFINTMDDCRFTLADVSAKIRAERIPTFVVTREPTEDYQVEAMKILCDNDWVEVRYNESVHAKVYVAAAQRESESFALFGSGNLTGRAITSNVEVGMMLYAQGIGRPLVDELYYWANNRLRTLPESRLHKPIRVKRKKP
jgi:phosphatidylserine/phosphatidylglycerophosphate/cardiolipin synthase-like enzyme